MEKALSDVFSQECYSRVQSLQLSQADLPRRFEDALTATNVALQESITVKQTQENVQIDMDTQVKQAEIKADVQINKANAKKTATLAKNEATMEAYVKVTKTEAEAYKAMKNTLTFATDQ